MNEQDHAIVVPQRADGTYKRFWYDPNFPGHILHRQDCAHIRTICVGHSHDA